MNFTTMKRNCSKNRSATLIISNLHRRELKHKRQSGTLRSHPSGSRPGSETEGPRLCIQLAFLATASLTSLPVV